MKFLCPNCKAKYRIGPEKMVGRQAAKIRCRKCEYLIQIAYRPNSDEFDVTATPPSAAPPPPSVPPPARLPKAPGVGQPPAGGALATGGVSASGVNAANTGAWGRLGAAAKEEGSASKKPTSAVPGLPGLGSPKSRSGAALLSDPSALGRRPLAPLPPPPVPPVGSAGLSAASSPYAAAAPTASGLGGPGAAPLPAAASNLGATPNPAGGVRGAAASSQLGDQFRESVQAGGAVEDLPQEGWFVGVNGVPLGPIPLADLRELAMAGHIDRRSLVWRDGQPEWRPLGKFPGLARVIDDGATPGRAEPPSPAPAAPVASRPNGANGHTGATHVATGFDVPRADAGERPSAWGDLDDEDDDEQPTTVKGRVSVMPSGAAPPSVASLPQPTPPLSANAPGTLGPGAPNPFGITSSLLSSPPPVSAPQQASNATASHGPPERAAPVSIISAIPEPDDAEDDLRPSGRSKWYLIAAAILFAFALGAIVTHLMRASPDKASSERSGTNSSGAARKKPYAEVELGSAEGSAGGGREPRPESITAALRPASVEADEGMTTARAALRPAPSSDAVPLLDGLGGSHEPASNAAPSEPAVGSGLDATAIQRTVRRYSPAVRQNCWLRALDARPPGVPNSAKLTATITVEAAGGVQSVAVSGAPRGYPSLSRCVETAVKGWQFPRSGAQTVTNVPFMFMGQ